MTTSKSRIQNYLRQNKISELFEEMMGKLIKDLPASPVYYLVNYLQDKEKKIKNIIREDRSISKDKKIEVSSNAMLWATAPAPTKKSSSPRDAPSQATQQSSPDARKYEKPWLTHAKKSPAKTKSGSKMNQTAPVDISKAAKPDWNQKNKISTDRKDDVVDGDDGLDLGLVYAKPKIVGETQVKIRNDDEEMEAELSLSGKHTETQDDDSANLTTNESKLSAKEAKRRRLEELKRLADRTKSKSEKRPMSPLVINDGSDDDALEILENAEELIREGVLNPPKTGVVIGHSGQKSKEEIELVLNMSKFFDELGGMEGINQSQVNGSDVKNKFSEDDEDFESASQVTGPRRPVWEAPESEVESVASQLRSARISGIGVDSFVTRPGSGEKPKEKPKREKPKHQTSERPRTAPSRSHSHAGSNISNGDVPETYQAPDPKPTKSPRSRPTTPKGSTVGSGRASRRMSQASNQSNGASPGKKEK